MVLSFWKSSTMTHYILASVALYDGAQLQNDNFQFLEEFYPDSALTSCPDSFTLHHYNGLVRGEGAVVGFENLLFCLKFRTWS